MQDYRKLYVWQKAHQLALRTYAVPAYLVKPEAWPLRDQILRSVISIPSNIAEGAGRGSDPDFRRFLWHSMGSCNELESQLLLARDLTFIPGEVHTRLGNDLSEVRKDARELDPDGQVNQSWQLATGSWQLATGNWQLAAGNWQLAAGN
jgi:four helix bundle protein